MQRERSHHGGSVFFGQILDVMAIYISLKSEDNTDMRRFPVVSTDTELNDRVARICKKFGNAFEPVFLGSLEAALEHIRFELPELQLVNFSDEAFDGLELIHAVVEDPWLHYGGVIGVYRRSDSQKIEELPRETNIITMIRRAEFVETFFRVLYLLYRNRQILFQRDIQLDFLGTVHGSFEMDNDPYNARTYASLMSNFLFNSNLVDIEMRDRLHVALFELIINAIEHGNCGITYDEKNAYLQEHGDILPLIRERCSDSRIHQRRVSISYTIELDQSRFVIKDEGGGFNWKEFIDRDDVNLDLHGHGLRMTKHYIENLTFNEKGNIASFVVPHRKLSNATPGIFSDQVVMEYEAGELVFSEGDESNDLFYIIDGAFDIIIGTDHVATLTADDLFLGEMSFLLGNRRTATVVARYPSRVVKITKNSFVMAIQRQPHYGIFLARLLAQRIIRLNRRYAGGV